MKFLLMFIFIVSASAQESNWMDDSWLREPELGDSRPDWWYDLRGLSGALVIVDGGSGEFKLPVKGWTDATVINSDGSYNRIRYVKVKVKIEKILFMSSDFSVNGPSFEDEKVVELWVSQRLSRMTGEWIHDKDTKLMSNKIYYLEKIGHIMPSEWHIKWTMPIERRVDLEKLFKHWNR